MVMAPSSGGSALPRSSGVKMGLGVLSHQAGHSAGLLSWAFGMPMARKWCKKAYASSLLWETVGSSGSVLPREDGWLRPLRACLTPEAKSFLTWLSRSNGMLGDLRGPVAYMQSPSMRWRLMTLLPKMSRNIAQLQPATAQVLWRRR